MTTITANDVQKLREQTGVGMMDCKKALTESGGDIEKAVQYLREKGLAKAAKKADREANEGAVFTAVNADRSKAAILELNCETDFVAGNDTFKAFGQVAGDAALATNEDNPESLQIDGKSFKDAAAEVVLKVGENITIKKITIIEGQSLQNYVHLNGKIGVVVSFDGEVSDDTAKDIAMQIAAVNPTYVKPEDVPPNIIDQEKEIIANQAKNEGKPEQVIEKIVMGRVQKFYKENCLMKQEFIKDSAQTIDKVLPNGVSVAQMVRFELG